MVKKSASLPVERKKVSQQVRSQVLIEAGYRCAVPQCRGLLVLDLHHLYQVSESGKDEPENLIALCPTDHARFHRGDISRDAVFAWKAMLIAMSRSFDLEAIDRLLFLEKIKANFLIVSGDGLLHFGRLIAAGLADVKIKANNNNLLVTYRVDLSSRGKMLIAAWRSGDHERIKKAVAGPVPGLDNDGNLPLQNE